MVCPWYIAPTPESNAPESSQYTFSRYTSSWDERGGAPMEVEILYFDGCPNYREAQATLEMILSQADVSAEVRPVAVNADEEARRLKFPGSPTLRVDGEDLFPCW